ncbi:protein kinase domain-containing protein [Acidovorax sp. LjRoot194]|uniref:protein kinase domain-containing protein n=1 Tax=Acidovorax sp. LjRoot194 TaxID=3342280 RepID=UPI003ECFC8AE
MIDTVGGSANCLAPGVQVGEYRLLDVIGEGGFGIVYRARDISLDRVVAIKEYMPATLAGRKSSNEIHVRSQHRGAFDAGLRSFINEARLLAKFSHPALVHVYRFFEFNGTAYMVMRHYEGQTFREFLTAQQDRMNQRMLAAIVGPVLDVVEMLHAADCYHRDIAPDNVFLQNSGMPVLLDFGAARRIIGDMTQALTMVLKPGFAPIEQYVDDGAMPQGAWTDIYQIGAMLYLAITGKPPATSVARMINDPVAALSTTTYPGYSAQFLHGVDRALAVKPQDRPQTIAALKELLGITTFTMPMSAPWKDPAASAPAVPLAVQADAAQTGPAPLGEPVRTVAPAHAPTEAPQANPAWDPLAQAPALGGQPIPLPSASPADAVFAMLPPAQPHHRQDGPMVSHAPPSDAAVVGNASDAALPPVDARASAAAATPQAAIPSTPSTSAKAARPQSGAAASGKMHQPASRAPALRWAAVGVAFVAVAALAVWWGTQGSPSSPPAAELAVNLDDQHWREAQAAGTVAALDGYLSSYPTGKHRSEAMALLNRMEVQEPVATTTPPAALPPAETVATAPGTPERPATPSATTPAATGSTSATATVPPKPETPAATEPLVAPKPTKPIGDVGRVVLRISPWGRISVNGSSLGTTPPLTHIELPEGSHRIEVSNPAAAPVVKTVQVKKGEPVVISHQFE